MKNNSKLSWGMLISILFPVLLLFEGITNIRDRYGRIALVLFITFFGYQLIYYVDGSDLGSGADCSRYSILFSWAANQVGISFNDFFSMLDSHDSVDYFNPILLFAVSRLTSNPHVYFMVYAFIFALFYINNIWTILEQCFPNKEKLWNLLFVVTCFILSIHDFGGIRMPLAFQVFLFGLFKYVFYEKKIGLLWIVATVLVHFSMIAFVILFFLFLLVKKGNIKFFFLFFIFGHLLSSIDVQFLQQYFVFLPNGIEDRMNIYTNEANMEQFAQSGRFYLGVMNLWGMIDSIILRFYIPVAMGLLFIKHSILNTKEEYLYKVSLYIYGCSLVLSNMPSGYRFMLPSSMVCFATISILYNQNELCKSILYKFSSFYSPLLVVFLIHRFRFILNEVGFSILYTNFVSMLYIEDNVTILETIKHIF